MQPKEKLTEKEREIGLSYVIKDGIASQTMATLTGGVFLVALALELGASNFLIGLLAAIPPLMQLFQLPASYLVEKIRNRRQITVTYSLISRLLLMGFIVIPFLKSTRLGLLVLIIGLSLHGIFSAIATCSWNTWMRDLIPENRLGMFFSKRLGLTTIFELFVSVGAALFIDIWLNRYPQFSLYAYSILFFLALIAGLISTLYLSKIPEPKMNFIKHNLNLIKLITKPLKNKNYRNLLHFLASWNFAINLAAPFFTVYLLTLINLSLTYVIGLQILSQLTNIFFYKIWGRFSQHHSNKTILSISSPIFIFSILAWTFTTLPDTHILTIPLLIFIHIAMGATLAGIKLASGNISFKLSPQEDSTSYLAAASFVNSISSGLAPVFGGLFVDFFSKRELSLTLQWVSPKAEFALRTFNLQHWDFFFLFAFVLGLYSLHRLSKVEEEGKLSRKEQLQSLIGEIRKEMRNLSTLAGLRPMIKFPVLFNTRKKSK